MYVCYGREHCCCFFYWSFQREGNFPLHSREHHQLRTRDSNTLAISVFIRSLFTETGIGNCFFLSRHAIAPSLALFVNCQHQVRGRKHTPTQKCEHHHSLPITPLSLIPNGDDSALINSSLLSYLGSLSAQVLHFPSFLFSIKVHTLRFELSCLDQCLDQYMSRRSKPKTRLQQLREQIVKMGGEDVATHFETLQLHAGESFI